MGEYAYVILERSHKNLFMRNWHNFSRSAAYIKMGQFNKAHQDAVKAKELNSEWPKVKESFIAAISDSIYKFNRCDGGYQAN